MDSSPASLQTSAAIDPSDLLIAQRVREIVGAGNLNQEELAKELGLSQPHVSRLLQGKTPWRKKYLQRLANLYNTTLNALLLEAEEVPIPPNKPQYPAHILSYQQDTNPVVKTYSCGSLFYPPYRSEFNFKTSEL